MTESYRRGIRTAAQLVIAVAATIGPIVAVFGVPADKVAGIGAALVAVGSTVTVVMNALEDRGVIPAILKPEVVEVEVLEKLVAVPGRPTAPPPLPLKLGDNGTVRWNEKAGRWERFDEAADIWNPITP